ncbi:TPA: sugar kinase [Yersinia enterocolitica]|nr:sugar kinase [Yersinia enterocolitica]
MSKVVCFGEVMLRLNPEGYLRILQSNKFEASYAGSETSVAVSLASLGVSSTFVTKLPKHEIGQAAINEIRRYGVNTDHILLDDERLGIYFVEKGASQRSSRVIYDRKNSSISLAKRNDFNWEEIFMEAGWFHFSGITPALGGNLPDICLDACRTAKKLGLMVSCDLNFRSQLWTTELASEVMNELMSYVDICIGNEEDAENVFGIVPKSNVENFQSISPEDYKDVASQLLERYNLKFVAFTLRESLSASRNLWSGLLYNGNQFHISKKYDVQIIDRLGAGDSFSAALIYSLIEEYSFEDTIDFAVAASCLKHSIEKDFNLVNVTEIMSLMNGNGSGRVRR